MSILSNPSYNLKKMLHDRVAFHAALITSSDLLVLLHHVSFFGLNIIKLQIRCDKTD